VGSLVEEYKVREGAETCSIYVFLTAELICLSKWQSHLKHITLLNDADVMALDLEHLIESQKASECKRVRQGEQSTCSATSPLLIGGSCTFHTSTWSIGLDVPVLRLPV
jgi:hypothetical protein